jgi:ABC-2 type transport system ATP-binding protein
MASVEELCDHITLINKSRNILSGQIDEVRQSYGSNVFEVAFRGETMLKANTRWQYELIKIDTENSLPKVQVRLTSQSDANALLQHLLPAVQIVSFNPIVPSMHDIFIQVVQEYNLKHGIANS